jgi:NTP pyrophosphatase (non-canonical NTP hydrolase)
MQDIRCKRIQGCVDDVEQFDIDHGVTSENEDSLKNIVYNCLCLSGEAGEVANVAKKMWRDGDSPELRKHLQEELVDCVIYICKLILIMKFDFDKSWVAKHVMLYDRWATRQMSTRKGDI